MSIEWAYGIGLGCLAVAGATDFPHKGSWWFSVIGVGLCAGALGAGWVQ